MLRLLVVAVLVAGPVGAIPTIGRATPRDATLAAPADLVAGAPTAVVDPPELAPLDVRGVRSRAVPGRRGAVRHLVRSRVRSAAGAVGWRPIVRRRLPAPSGSDGEPPG